MRFSAKDIATISITVALTVVIGAILYILGSVVPIPGNKFIVFAAFLGAMFYIPAHRVGRIGSITVMSAVFAAIMGFVNVLMSVAILSAGITTDLITLLLFRDYRSDKKKIFSAGLYPATAFIWAFAISYYFMGNRLFLLVGDIKILAVTFLVIYGLGIIGATMSRRTMKRIIKASEK